MPSLARLGVGEDQRPRLERLGWIEAGDVLEPARQLLLSLRSGPDPDGALNRMLALAERRPDLLQHNLASLAALAGASRSLWDSLLRHPEWLDSPPLDDDPRLLVQGSLVGIAQQDLTGTWPLEQVARAVSQVADGAARLALAKIVDATPEAPRFAIIGLGKWGAEELNYSSDIDLVFVYLAGEAPDRDRRLAHRMATSFVESLSQPTKEGIAFRVDATLRPEGAAGPLVRTLDGYSSYYERWGEAWEFQALLKARSVAGDAELGAQFIDMANTLVWPDTLPPDTVRELRHLKQRAEEESSPDDIKRSPGGIRDVEFTVQLLQLIHGRADLSLRVSGTLPALEALVAGDYVRSEDALALADSYRFLRTVEHRLQLWQMSQTHTLPSERENLALAMGYRPGTASPVEQFQHDLNRHRARVRELHEDLYYRPLLEALSSSSLLGLERSRATERLTALGFQDVAGAARSFEQLTSGLSRRSRLMQQLLPLMLDWLADSPDPDLGLAQLTKLVDGVGNQNDLIGTLRDRPLAAQRLCTLLGSSRLVGTFLDRLPEFLPRLADDRLLTDLPIGEAVAQTALERMRLRTDRDSRTASLRRLVRRRMLRVAAADLLGLADVDQVSQALSDTADAATRAALWTAQEEEGGELTVVAMGKWGGGELGYSSDLDLMYVGTPGEASAQSLRTATDFAAVIGQPTVDGLAYRVDADLRPEGRKGALVRSLEAYRLYYELRAEPWERLALIKARPVAGERQAEFGEIRVEHAFPAAVSSDDLHSIRHIKARVERERIPRGEDPEFHLKLGPGGLSDIEFLVQLWQLRLGRRYPSLQTTSTVSALTALAEVDVLTETEAEQLTQTYRFCTELRNRLYLQTGRPHDSLPIDPAEMARLARSLGSRDRAQVREKYRQLTRRSRRLFERLFFED